MSVGPGAELTASTIIRQIEEGSMAREVLLSFARALLPLERDDVIAVVACLAVNEDEEVAEVAGRTLHEMPTRLKVGFAANPAAPPESLTYLARATTDLTILEALIRNRALPDEAVMQVALTAEPGVQDVIVTNQARILREPGILDSLLANPALSPDARRRALEVREEFFDKKARVRALELLPDLGIDPALENEPLDAIADLLEAAELAPPPPFQTVAPLPEGEDADPKSQALFAQVLKMSVAQKVLLAFRGDRTARMILVRERNRLVAAAAIRNPRITESEVEMVAGMRNVEEEVLRIIGLKRDWVSKYPIILALCRNAKAPVGVVLSLINRLTLRDLKGLKDDKGVSEAARSAARRAFTARTQKS